MNIYEQLYQKDVEIVKLKAQVVERDSLFKRCCNEITDLQAALARRPASPDPRVEEARTKIRELQAKIREKDTETIVKGIQLKSKDAKIEELENEAKEYRTLFARNDEKDALIEALSIRHCLEKSRAAVQRDLNAASGSDTIIDKLQARVSELQTENNVLTSELRVTNTNCDNIIGKLQAKVSELQAKNNADRKSVV